MTNTKEAPRWMRNTLIAAGVYNIAWGAFAVLFPNAVFEWLSMPLPNYPQFWQCIGMIVGVYGVGYIIAAFDPVRHWPIVLVGLLGKVFGPLGMVGSLWSGALPWGFALNCVTNDVIWWVPFVIILKHALERELADPLADDVPDESVLLRELPTTTGSTLAALSKDCSVLVVFLRHSGCTFCREALADLTFSAICPRFPIRSGGSTALSGCGAGRYRSCSAGRFGCVERVRFSPGIAWGNWRAMGCRCRARLLSAME
jgi:hypothetical protein